MPSPPSIALVYDSGFGHTAVVAEEVAKGLHSVNGTEVTLFKVFMHATGKLWYPQHWKGKLATGFTNSKFLCGARVAAVVKRFA